MDKKKQQQQARRRQEDAALNKLLIWFAIAIGYEAIVLLLKRFYVNFHTNWEIELAYGLSWVLRVLRVAGPLLTIAAVVWLVMRTKQGASIRVPAICAAALFALSFTVFVAYTYSAGLDLLSAVAPTAAVLALIYYLYQREFFCNTIFTAGGILSLWLYRRMYQTHPTRITIGFVVGWLLLAAVAFAAYRLSQTNGKWKQFQLFPEKASYLPTYVTCAVTALTMAAAMLAGAAAAFYAIFVLVIWLFCMAVYYTVRML